MKKYLIIALLFLAACSNEEEAPTPAVMEVKNLGQLSTVEYTIGKIIQMDQSEESWYKWGDRKILIKTRAVVKAGIDLNKIKEDDISIKGKTIEITLPESEYISFNMDPNYTKTEVESVSGFRDNFTQKEKNAILRQGEEAIKKDLEKTRILKDASSNAEDIIRDFYKEMGFERVIVHSAEEE